MNEEMGEHLFGIGDVGIVLFWMRWGVKGREGEMSEMRCGLHGR